MQKVESALGGDEPKCGIQPSPIPIVDNPTALSSHARGWQHRPTEKPFPSATSPSDTAPPSGPQTILPHALAPHPAATPSEN
jgi:hypothetical protein